MKRDKKLVITLDIKRKKPRIGVLFTKTQPNKKRKARRKPPKHKHKELT